MTLVFNMKWSKRSLIVIIVVLDLVFSAWFVATMHSGMQSKNAEEITVRDDYKFPKPNHDPVKITSDADFTSANGVTGGSGTADDPYIISGLIIDGKNAGYGIYITGTTKNFTIMNCEVFNASGGDYSPSAPNSGLVLYNLKAYTIDILANSLHHNLAAGLHISTVTAQSIYIDADTQGRGNRIFLNGRGGIYVSSTTGLTSIYKNMIFNNHVGIQMTSSGAGSGKTMYIHYNGISNNLYEGIQLSSTTDSIKIYNNVFYKNYGTNGYFNSSKSQASQTGCSGVTWNENFWYDLAENNETNYNTSTMKIGIPYSIGGSDGAKDDNPVKGVPHNPIEVNLNKHSNDDNVTFSVMNGGVVGGLGTQEYPYIISGWNLTGVRDMGGYTTKDGYGLMLNNSLGYRYLIVDGLVVHDVVKNDQGYTDIVRSGIGIVDNMTGHNAHMILTNLSIYGCANYGIYVRGDVGETNEPIFLINNSYIHNNLAGIGLFDYPGAYEPDVYVENTTIDSHSHGGMYITMGTVIGEYLSVSNNDVGVDAEDYGDVDISYSSFYKNTRWGVRFGTGTSGSNVSESIFYENNGATGIYSSSHIQVYSAESSNHIWENMYYDWVNNNNTNDFDNDGVIDWAYTAEGSGGIVDAHPVKWVHISHPLVIDGDEYLNKAPYHGVWSGIIGGSGSMSDEYLVIGWNVTEVGINIATINVMNIHHNYVIINNVRTESGDHGDGVYLFNDTATVKVTKSQIINCYYVGIRISQTPYFSIDHNIITGSNEIAGIEIYSSQNGLGIVQYNSISKSLASSASGIYINDHSSSYLGSIQVRYNQIFGNTEGIYVRDSSGIEIYDNGIAYNKGYGIELDSSNNNEITGNIFYHNNHTYSTFAKGYYQAYDNGDNDWNGSSYGNYWNDWALNNDTNTEYANPNIVKYPYHIYGGSNKDGYPYKNIPSNPIRIDNQGELDWNHGIAAGDGSSAYPYVMASWSIDNNNNGYGIYVGNLTGPIYFAMENVIMATTTGGSSSDIYHSNSGIIIYNYSGEKMGIYFSTSYGNDGDGLRVYNSWDIDVYRSLFQSNKGDGIDITNTQYIDIEYANCSENQLSGIFVSDSHSVNVEYSTFYKNKGEGIWMSNTDNGGGYGLIYNNTFKNNTEYGVALTSSNEFLVTKNIFINNHNNNTQGYDDSSTEYTNRWNSSSEGNCWSDYSGTGPYAIGGGSEHDYWAQQCSSTNVPEFNSLPFAVLAFVALLVLYRRRNTKK